MRTDTRTTDNAAPLSFVQRRLWMLHQLEVTSAALSSTVLLRLEGRLDIAALQAAIDAVAARHNALRARFEVIGGVPRQVTVPASPVPVGPIRDLSSGMSPSPAELGALAAEVARTPFPLEAGRLLRAALLRTGADDHALILAASLMAVDDHSWPIIVGDLIAAYSAGGTGRAPSLPAPRAHHADFARHQQDRWNRGGFSEHLEHGRRVIGDAAAMIDLPTDRPRPPVRGWQGGAQRFCVPAELVGRLRSLSRHEDATMFTAQLAVLNALVHRYTREDDLLLSFLVSGRDPIEWKDAVGPFGHSLPLRVDLRGRPTFRELLRRTGAALRLAQANRELPFGKLAEELRPRGDFSLVAPYQLALGMAPAPVAADVAGLRVTQLPVDLGVCEQDLLVVASPGDDMEMTVRYSVDLFDAETIARLAGHWTHLLAAAVAEPDRRLSELRLLAEEERSWLLADLNRTEEEYPRDCCVHELVEARARQRPTAEAVAFQGQTLSYGELNDKANRLANRLRRDGVGPEVLVAVCLERSLDLVVALLGVLKTGGAYVPLDPRYPEERLAYMLADTDARVLLTQERLLDELPATSARILCMDRDWAEIEVEDPGNRPSGVTARNLAYVVYTSGSTGRPKGVQIEHEALLNMVFWDRRSFDLTSRDRATQIAGQAFDASVWEIWPCLTAGAALCVADEEARTSPSRLRDWLVENRVTFAWSPTSLAEGLMALEPPEGLLLRTLLIGGDQLHRPARPQPYRVVNNYGPAEYTVVTTWGDVESRPGDDSLPSIGRPLPNTQLYVLDERLEPLPRGVAGELYIGGDGLARGYLGRPDQTAARFLPNPHGGAGARMYATGDLTRYLPDGNLEFLGRMDNQVKLRGVRIELGEIETILRRHPGVQEAVVVVREDEPGHKRLVAYVGSDTGGASADDLRALLRGELPDYMIPATFVVLRSLPINRNGKVDRAALPVPEVAAPVPAPSAPSNATEAAIAEIWERVLERPVGAHDDFLELGGYSLHATLVIAQLRASFDVSVPLRTFFSAPTVARLAHVVDDLRSPAAKPG